MADDYSEIELRKIESVLNDIEERVLYTRRMLRKSPKDIPVEISNTKFVITSLLECLPVRPDVYCSD